MLKNSQNLIRRNMLTQAFADPFLFGKGTDDIQHIDQMMLRYGSVSSLREFHLFGPPAYIANQPA